MVGDASESPRSARRGSRVGRLVVVLLVVGMVSMWGYVVYLAFGPGRQPPPDQLDDPAFAIAAQARCRVTLQQVAALPAAVDSPSAVDRAEVIDEANGHFSAMLDDLAALAPAGDDGDLVREWLADWRTYLGDREAYARALRRDPAARLLVTPKRSHQVTEYLDAFAGDNHMPACATPLDVS